MSASTIRLRGIRQNNLQGFDLELPLGKLVVVTGRSGAGKSSLVFETLHAEGQRRYVETFSPYTRQFLDMLDRPDVDEVENIRPSIAIQQSNTVKTTRSTVGTMTELCDFFKVWWTHVAALYDPQTGEKVEADTPQTIWAKVRATEEEGLPLLVTFRLTRPGKLKWQEIFDNLAGQGYTRLLRAGEAVRMDEFDPASLADDEVLYVVQDRVRLSEESTRRFVEAAGTALHFGHGELFLWRQAAGGAKESWEPVGHFSEGLHSPTTGATFNPATPALFSFNSPVGACERCRGFGRVIEIDPNLVVPDWSATIAGGAIRAFAGSGAYAESQVDLLRACKKNGVPVDVAWRELTEEQRRFVWDGEPGYTDGDWEAGKWYGVRGFFAYLESKVYKMHVRVFLSRYRAYLPCPDCEGARLGPEALQWKWAMPCGDLPEGGPGERVGAEVRLSLPDLYRLPVSDLLALLQKHFAVPADSNGAPAQQDLALSNILTRLRYLEQVGLGYLTLDRTSRTLSGGETMRVDLTACLGTSLVDTLFVLDEPSIGLHARDMDRLLSILRRLTELGNTVVVVEHDEAVMRAADWLVEIGPEPGKKGGRLVFSGTYDEMLRSAASLTGQYLSGKKRIENPDTPRPVDRALAVPPPKGKRSAAKAPHPVLYVTGAQKHNLRGVDVALPLQRLVCLSGVSGSGKSTLLDNVLYQGLRARRGQAIDDAARVESLEATQWPSAVVRVDQSPVSRTPRSNPALCAEVWDPVRELFFKEGQVEVEGAGSRGKSTTVEARAHGFTLSHFSFNSGEGRCPHCQGLGHEQVEMQFMADVFVRCPVCDGARFRPEVLQVKVHGTAGEARNVTEVLAMTVDEAAAFFGKSARVRRPLETLQAVGLGYLPLGQPLNTLSGGEAQRLKLVKYLGRYGGSGGVETGALLLLDEPTTGLHKDDVKRLIAVLQELVGQGHSVVVIEHNLDVLKCADWIIEMGPEAGRDGGQVVFAGTPRQLAGLEKAARAVQPVPQTRAYLCAEMERSDKSTTEDFPVWGENDLLEAAEAPVPFESGANGRLRALEVRGARAHNLRGVSLDLPHGEFAVVTGVSGSGKSTLAFDIIFAEGQRRFLESMSAYARQFVEQLPRAEVDSISGIPPTVAIEQRVTRGTGKSTVATITEVAQYLRLLYARAGIQHSPETGAPVVSLSPAQLAERFHAALLEQRASKAVTLPLCAPLVRGRKGHHEPLAKWAQGQGFTALRIDGAYVPLHSFEKLDRYREHDIEAVAAEVRLPAAGSKKPARLQLYGKPLLTACSDIVDTEGRVEIPLSASGKRTALPRLQPVLSAVLQLGGGACFLAGGRAEVLGWFSTERTDPVTGEAFPELDPKHFSWNSKKGWCPSCRGHGRLFGWMNNDENFEELPEDYGEGETCPVCHGERLNRASRAVRLPVRGGRTVSLPELLRETPGGLLKTLKALKLDVRGRAIARDLVPEVEERLRFLGEVGLDYLTLERATNTLSGGEAQRIRLAAQLGSTLAGVLYVLDEPSIGLHARDNDRLLESLGRLRDKGNSLLVVEHDEDTMRRADRVIDLGPGAGRHGGEVVAQGPWSELAKDNGSLTARYLHAGIAHPLRGHRRDLPAKPFDPRGRPKEPEWLALRAPRLRNLKGDDLYLPLGRLVMVGGISGAGKSTLVRELLHRAVRAAIALKKRKLRAADFARVDDLRGPDGLAPFADLYNGDLFSRVIEVDQSPIGKTPRSTPATYIGAFDLIRQFFAGLPEARAAGYSASTFSFNTKGGRCEKCSGAGRVKLEMNFMPDTYVDCDGCGGARYGRELLDLRWKDRNIAEVLEMSFEEAAGFFSFHQRLHAMLTLMVETGLGYLTLGQSSPTLSGGEAQRLKLVSELSRGLSLNTEELLRPNQRGLYILEEPTIGLHFRDCERLIHVLHRLVDQGHTVVVIEHNTDLLAEADWLVEIGPEGGDKGGEILYQGPARGILQCRRSRTAPYLRDKLKA